MYFHLSTQELIKESDERDKQSAMMDAKLNAIRQQNKVYYILYLFLLFLLVNILIYHFLNKRRN